ncbi:hypothetical protein ACJX0J_028249 [Zea mays]
MNFEYYGGRTLLAGLLIALICYTSNSYVQIFCYVTAVFRWTSSIGFIKISGGLWHNSIFTFSVEKSTKCCYIARLYIYFMEIYLHRLMNVLYMCMCTWRAMICHYLSENTASNISRWHYHTFTCPKNDYNLLIHSLIYCNNIE